MYSNLPNCKIVKNCDFWNIKYPKSIWDSIKRDDELNELRVKSYLGHCSPVEFFRIGGTFFVNPFIALIKPDTIPARDSIRSLETRNCTLGLLPRTTFRVRGLIFSLGFNLVTDCGGVIAQRSTHDRGRG